MKDLPVEAGGNIGLEVGAAAAKLLLLAAPAAFNMLANGLPDSWRRSSLAAAAPAPSC